MDKMDKIDKYLDLLHNLILQTDSNFIKCIRNIISNPLFTFNQLNKYKIFEPYLTNTYNPNFTTPDYILKYINQFWDWHNIQKYIPFDVYLELLNTAFIKSNVNIDKLPSEFQTNLPFEFIIKYSNHKWDWVLLFLQSSTLTPNIIEQNIEQTIEHSINHTKQHNKIKWNYDLVVKNKNFQKHLKYVIVKNKFVLSCDFIDKYPKLSLFIKNIVEPTYYNLSYHPDLTIDFIIKNMNLKWNWEIVYNRFGNPHKYIKLNNIDVLSNVITISEIVDNVDWNWSNLSKNKNITLNYIDSNLHLPWNWNTLSENQNITIEFIVKHIKKPFNWNLLSKHPNITMDHITSYKTFPWNYGYVSSNPNLTINFIIHNFDKNWNVYELSINTSIC